MKSLVASVALAAAAFALPQAASAQAYPERTITMVVPFAAGGPTDTVTRLVAEAMSKDLGQQIIVENVGGAGGTLGAGRVASAEPDGYTLLLHHIGMATSATLYRKLRLRHAERLRICRPRHRGADDHRRRARISSRPTSRASIEYVKANKDTVTVANAGIGAASHLCGMLFMSAIETPLVTVPYKGTGPAMTDLLGGQVDIMCDQTTNTTKQIQGGTIKAYAVTSPARLDVLPDVPTADEGGLPGFQVGIWHGLYAPKGTPAEVDRAPVEVAAGRAEGPERRRALRRTRHRAVVGGRRDAGRAQGQARRRDRALEAGHRGGRPVRRLICDLSLPRHPLPGRRPRLPRPRDFDADSARRSAAVGRDFHESRIDIRPDQCALRRALHRDSALFFAWQSLGLELGTAFRMGPGYFPLVLAVLLIAARRRHPRSGDCASRASRSAPIAWRGMLFILPAPIIFGLTVRGLGFVPAIFLTALIASFASPRMKPLDARWSLAVALTVFSTLVFSYGARPAVPSASAPGCGSEDATMELLRQSRARLRHRRHA